MSMIETSIRWDSGYCHVCGESISDDSRFAYLIESYKRGNKYFYAEPICKCCSLNNQAVIEAEDERRRFTSVRVAIEGSGLSFFSGSRCSCGNSALSSGNCPSCMKVIRMLDKKQAELNILKKVTSQFNKQLKEYQNVAK